ncbi:uncharacterized protein LOC127285688 [Leptopilina boulardi]|uniref:uncharacterized protein LOC127285688 n=1 Tax=Leptopilina boulardi TaxID=63433 RepID=UPI0021F69CA3|nr:uncharacterized protein LOC127285688 [Leptopilina boulardi]
MGDLPKIRVNQARPFSHVGIDYCGPFFIKEKKYRNRTKIKIYIAVFVCLVVKAVHLEVVSDVSTETFLGALRRFIGRRGKPNVISSDNGSNFIGANNELKDLGNLLRSEKFNEQTAHILNDQGIEWKFIPPLSPHFEGIWESAVKSFKHHFKRVVKDVLFTFEEINTFVIEIEAVLNSRPLTPISNDPNDVIALTPGHVLIGDSLTSLPELNFKLTPTPRLSRWQHLQKMRQDFWNRSHKEYLNGLNMRHKWKSGNHRIRDGTIVILKEDNTSPLQWVLGRVTKIFPGSDGVIRTVIVKRLKANLNAKFENWPRCLSMKTTVNKAANDT